MTTSKKPTKKSSTISLRDFDPENEDFGAEASSYLGRNKKGASLQHGHLGDVSIKGSNFAAFDEKKYSGKAVSKKDLYNSEDDSVESEEESNLDSSEEYESLDETEEEEELEYSDDSDEYSGEDFSEDSEKYAESDDGDEDEIEVKDSNGLAARMRELEMAEEQNFELISRSDHRREGDDERSQHVRNQMTKFDDYVNVRFKLQPLLNASNRFPKQKLVVKAKRRSSEISETLVGAVDELEGLMQDLLEMSVSELRADGIEIPSSSFVDDKSPDAKSKLQSFWDELTRIDAALDPFARSSLQKWHNKMALSSDLKAKKTLRMLNQDPYQQVQMAMQDEERLLSRTRIYRDTSKPRILGRPKAGDSEIAEERSREFDDIFDDNDFYQVLLKDWTASHGALASSTASAMSAVLLPTSSVKKQHRQGVDPRASKGRKIRYDVHPKLVNYMVPQIEKAAWNDSKIDEFFASLLGQ